jgi:hypothetical protein
MWYTYTIDKVLFVSSNTEMDFVGAGEEYTGTADIFPSGSFGRLDEYFNWLNNTLRGHVMGDIVVFGHRPLEQLPKNIQAVIDEHAVVYLCGHTHAYKHTRRSSGVDQYVIGTGGSPETPIDTDAMIGVVTVDRGRYLDFRLIFANSTHSPPPVQYVVEHDPHTIYGSRWVELDQQDGPS